jgi:hypothetical protein
MIILEGFWRSANRGFLGRKSAEISGFPAFQWEPRIVVNKASVGNAASESSVHALWGVSLVTAVSGGIIVQQAAGIADAFCTAIAADSCAGSRDRAASGGDQGAQA